MSKDETKYTRVKSRTLQSLREKSMLASKGCHKHLGSQHPPLLDLEPSQIVADELHLLLRIGDVLLNNLILYMDGQDHRRCERQGMTASYVRRLEQEIRGCGVSFAIWCKKDADGKPAPGRLDCTALNGSQKLRVLRNLPPKLETFIDEAVAAKVAKLWIVSVAFSLTRVEFSRVVMKVHA